MEKEQIRKKTSKFIIPDILWTC